MREVDEVDAAAVVEALGQDDPWERLGLSPRQEPAEPARPTSPDIDVSAILGPGVYLLAYHGRVVHVGQARAVWQRIYAHRTVNDRVPKVGTAWLPTKGFIFDQVLVRHCRVEDLDRMEAEMATRYGFRRDRANRA